MAKQKRVVLLDDSDDEPQVPKPQNEQEDSSEEVKEATSSDEDEDTDEGEDERDKHELLPKKLQPQMVSKPSSSSEDETDSEPEPDPVLDNTKSSLKLKSPASQPKSGSKRPAMKSIERLTQPKRGKKAREDHAAGSDEEDPKKSRDESKPLFQRVFSEEDETGILKGLSDFITKTGKEPNKSFDEFYDFMKGSNLIGINPSCNQLKDKIRRMKKKFENNLAKEKNGKGTTLKPHELEALQLGKNVWGHNGRGGEAVRNEVPKKEKVLSGTSLALSSFLRYDGTFGKRYGEDYIRKGIELLGVSKREEIEARWKKFGDAENKLYAEIAEFYAEQAKLICQTNSSSSS